MNTKINKKNLILLIVLAVIIGGGLYSWLDIDFSGVEKIKSYLSDFRFIVHLDESEIKEPQISSLPDQMSFEAETPDITEELTEEALSLEKTKDVLGQETTALPEKKKLTLEEIAEQVNEISKKVTIISVQVQELSLKELKATLAQIAEQGEDSEETQSALDEVAEKINEISEKIETITLQLEHFSSEQTC
jgi:DNA repair exonuclease SbcCD ATPase subunit